MDENNERIRLHAALTLDELLDFYMWYGLITQERVKRVMSYKREVDAYLASQLTA